MSTIYLIRHGQASFGADNYDELSALGRRQALLVGDYMRDCGIVLHAAYSGDLCRQQETARLALSRQRGEVPLHIDSRFNEIDNDAQIRLLLPEILAGNPAIRELVDSGLNDSKSYQKLIDAVFNYWVSPECDNPRLQSWADFSAAARAALDNVMRAQGSKKTLAIFSSGGTIATLVAQVLGLGGAQTYQLYEPMMNCSVTRLFYSADRLSLSCFNDCSYLRVAGARSGEELTSYR